MRERAPGPDLGEARSRAFRLAVAPFAFQAARSAKQLGVLGALRGGPKDAATLAEKTGLPRTSVDVLLDACLAVELVAEDPPGTWRLTTIGAVWIIDPRVIADADFTQDVCWAGLSDLPEALRRAEPLGLRTLGPWKTIYEGLTILPEPALSSWFNYDNGHSDRAFGAALDRIAPRNPARVLDIGANIGRFAKELLARLPEVRMTLLDHPAQLAIAEATLREAGLVDRATFAPTELLDPANRFPGGHDLVWLSQVLDCFGPKDIVSIFTRARAALAPGGQIWVLEVCPDRQSYPAAADALRLESLYFTVIANGVSRFYRSTDYVDQAELAGLRLVETVDGIGTAHSILVFEPI